MKQIESIFWGAIAALGALVIQLVALTAISTFRSPYGQTVSLALLTTVGGIIAAAFIEESFKYIVITKRIEYLSLEKTFIVNSLFVGLGFFAVELALLHLKNIPLMQNLPLLAEVGIIHTATAGIIGYLIATKNPRKLSTPITTLLIVTAVHSAYNILVNYRTPSIDLLIYSLLGLLIIVTIFNLFRISSKLAT